MSNLIKKAYDPEHFRKQAHQLVDMLADHLSNMQSGQPTTKAINWTYPEPSLEWWREDFEQEKNDDWIALFAKLFDHSVHLHHPQYMGHQLSAPLPVTALAGFLSDFLNNGMGVYEMGVASSTLERVVAEKIAATIGWGESGGGFLTSGGTLGNLTALLCARSVKASDAVWTKGNQKQLALMVSEQAHYCVDRAVKIMGWGEAGIIKVPSNERFEMRTDLLEEQLSQARAEGKEVIAVVGSACSTSTGSFDDLAAIGAFCQKHNIWFHVDGAHGAAIIFSEKYRHLLKGLELADSFIMDFHKMLLTPSITTALIFKEETNSFRTFAQKAQYLWNKEGDGEWFNYAKRTFECTKLMMSAKVYATLKTYGTALWEEYIDRAIDLGRDFATAIAKRKQLELAVAPACNIICFRYLPLQENRREVLNRLNDAIRQQLLEEGNFYIVKTVVDGILYLRCTLTNPFTTTAHLNALLDRIEFLGKEKQAQQKAMT